MKKLLLLLSVTLTVLFVSCDKNDDGPDGVYGKWKLVETMYDPGDGSGKYIKVEQDLFLVLNKSGKVEGNAVPNVASFKVLGSGTMEINNKDPKQTITYRYKIIENSLWLYPPCIEGCGLHFTRY